MSINRARYCAESRAWERNEMSNAEIAGPVPLLRTQGMPWIVVLVWFAALLMSGRRVPGVQKREGPTFWRGLTA
ncbi:hypothetical protein [Eoetvoesiella caeni]